MTQAIAQRDSNEVMRQGRGVQIRTMEEALEFAGMVAKSQFAPKEYRNRPGDIVVAMQMGLELGLAPMQALQNIAVINGRPSVWGDAMLAIVRSHPECLDVVETFEGRGEARRAVCIVKRRGCSFVTRTFSVGDAMTAGLWGKSGPWTQYPERMLQMRARSFACRDAFPDGLRGMACAEEVRDIPHVDAEVVDSVVEPASVPRSQAVQPKPSGEKDPVSAAMQLIDTARTVVQLESVAEMLRGMELHARREDVVAAFKAKRASLVWAEEQRRAAQEEATAQADEMDPPEEQAEGGTE